MSVYNSHPYVALLSILTWLREENLHSALQQLKPNFPALPLKHGQVDPEQRELFHQFEFVVATNGIAIGKACIPRQRNSGLFPLLAVARYKHIERQISVLRVAHIVEASRIEAFDHIPGLRVFQDGVGGMLVALRTSPSDDVHGVNDDFARCIAETLNHLNGGCGGRGQQDHIRMSHGLFDGIDFGVGL